MTPTAHMSALYVYTLLSTCDEMTQ